MIYNLLNGETLQTQNDKTNYLKHSENPKRHKTKRGKIPLVIITPKFTATGMFLEYKNWSSSLLY